VVAVDELDEGERRQAEHLPGREPRALRLGDERPHRGARPLGPAGVRVDERANAECGTPRARLVELLRQRVARLLHEPRRAVPPARAQLGHREVRPSLRAPEILAALPVPLFLDGEAGPRGLKVVDRPEVDKRERRLRRVRARPCLQLAPLLEQVPAWAVPQPELRPEPVEEDVGERPRIAVRAEHAHRRFRLLDRPPRIVRREADELRVDAGRELAVGGRRPQGRLEVPPRRAAAADPRDLAKQVVRLPAQRRDRRPRCGLGQRARGLDVASGEPCGGLAEPTSRQLFRSFTSRQPCGRGQEIGGGLRCAAPSGPRRSALDLGGDVLVRACRAER
jgi:hypothetical protein